MWLRLEDQDSDQSLWVDVGDWNTQWAQGEEKTRLTAVLRLYNVLMLPRARLRLRTLKSAIELEIELVIGVGIMIMMKHYSV